MCSKFITENPNDLRAEVRQRLEEMNPTCRLQELMRLQEILTHRPEDDENTILTYWLKSDDKRRGSFNTNLARQVD